MLISELRIIKQIKMSRMNVRLLAWESGSKIYGGTKISNVRRKKIFQRKGKELFNVCMVGVTKL